MRLKPHEEELSLMNEAECLVASQNAWVMMRMPTIFPSNYSLPRECKWFGRHACPRSSNDHAVTAGDCDVEHLEVSTTFVVLEQVAVRILIHSHVLVVGLLFVSLSMAFLHRHLFLQLVRFYSLMKSQIEFNIRIGEIFWHNT